MNTGLNVEHDDFYARLALVAITLNQQTTTKAIQFFFVCGLADETKTRMMKLLDVLAETTMYVSSIILSSSVDFSFRRNSKHET